LPVTRDLELALQHDVGLLRAVRGLGYACRGRGRGEMREGR
jgi:hypothetical protein